MNRQMIRATVAALALALAGCAVTGDPTTSTYHTTSTHEVAEKAFAAALRITLTRRVVVQKSTKTVRAPGFESKVDTVSTSKFGASGETADLICAIAELRKRSPDVEVVPTPEFWEHVAKSKDEMTIRELFRTPDVVRLRKLNVDFLVAAFHQTFDIEATGGELLIQGGFADVDRDVAAGVVIDLNDGKVLNASQFVYESHFSMAHVLVVVPFIVATRASSDPCAMIGEAAAAVISDGTKKPSPRVLFVATKSNPYDTIRQPGDRPLQFRLHNCTENPAACEDVDLDDLYTRAHQRGPVEGWRLYCRAAHMGHLKARMAVANYYRRGAAPVSKDLVKAFVWYSLAEQDGHSWAGTNRRAVEKEMTVTQRAEATRSLARWKPDYMECERAGEGLY